MSLESTARNKTRALARKESRRLFWDRFLRLGVALSVIAAGLAFFPLLTAKWRIMEPWIPGWALPYSLFCAWALAIALSWIYRPSLVDGARVLDRSWGTAELALSAVSLNVDRKDRGNRNLLAAFDAQLERQLCKPQQRHRSLGPRGAILSAALMLITVDLVLALTPHKQRAPDPAIANIRSLLRAGPLDAPHDAETQKLREDLAAATNDRELSSRAAIAWQRLEKKRLDARASSPAARLDRLLKALQQGKLREASKAATDIQEFKDGLDQETVQQLAAAIKKLGAKPELTSESEALRQIAERLLKNAGGGGAAAGLAKSLETLSDQLRLPDADEKDRAHRDLLLRVFAALGNSAPKRSDGAATGVHEVESPPYRPLGEQELLPFSPEDRALIRTFRALRAARLRAIPPRDPKSK
ncbi:MAG: hypothetical protein V3W41_07325 [Planctomycetota bacterium]